MERSHAFRREGAEEKPLFKVTLMRHEEPHYKDIGHDLTDRGVENARTTGKRLKEEGHLSEEDNTFAIHSPKARAKGTLGFVLEGAELTDVPIHSSHQMRMSDIPDRAAFMDYVSSVGHDQETIARDHHTHERFQNDPSFIEPNMKKRERLYRAFEYLIRYIEKRKESASEKTPHAFSVSHFELASLLVHDVFDIENIGTYNAPAFGELVTVEAYPTENKDVLRLQIQFKEHLKTVYFDRATRSIRIESELDQM